MTGARTPRVHRKVHDRDATRVIAMQAELATALPLAGVLLRQHFRRAYPVAMPRVPDYYTAEMVLAMPDDGLRRELVWGELLVNPAPELGHQRIVMRLAEYVVAYCRRHDVGEVFDVAAD